MTARGGQTPETDDLSTRFQQQARSRLADDRARKERGPRILLVALSTLASLAPLIVVVMGLKAGVGIGTWVGVCALGSAVGVGAVALAVRGRTRWACTGFFVAFTLGSLGDALSGRLLH